MFRQQVARSLDVDDVEWAPSVTAAEELISEPSSDPVDVAVLSPEVKDEDAIGFAEAVGTISPTTATVMVRDRTWNGTLLTAIRAGIRDVVDLTEGTEELRAALDRAIQWSDHLRAAAEERGGRALRRGMIISIFSSKGGTGKTFLATNLGAAMAEMTNADTAIVDLDLDMGDVFSYFGTEPGHRIQDLIALGENADRDTIFAAATKLGEHLYGFGAPPDLAAEEIAGGAIGKFLRSLRANFAFTIVDATADYSDLALAAFDLSDAICLITGLDIVGVKHLSKALETLMTIGLPKERFRVVLNRADSKVGLDADDVERVMQIRVDAMVPSSVLVPMSLNKGRPVYWDDPKSEVSLSVARFAEKLVREAGFEVEAETTQAEGTPETPAPERRRLGLFGRR